MRSLLILVAACCLCGIPAVAQVSIGTWAQVLTSPVGTYLSAPQLQLPPAQSAALTRFIERQYCIHRDFYDSTNIVGCSTPDCLRIQPLGSSFPGVFVVSPTPRDKNPAWWLIRFEGVHVVNLTPVSKNPPNGDLSISWGYLSVLKPTHHGLRDLSITLTSGANEQGVAYLQFDGVRYRSIASQDFKTCNQTPGHAAMTDDSWCLPNGTIVANRQ